MFCIGVSMQTRHPLSFCSDSSLGNPSRSLWIGLVLWFALAGAARPEDLSYNRDIRPILAENCFYCHGQDPNHREGELRLDRRDLAIEKGAIVPGKSVESELVRRILSTDHDLQMPPPESNRSLTDPQKQLLARWIDLGAPEEIHWSFQPPRHPNPQEIRDADWPKTPIDAFVLAQLRKVGLSPNPPADRATLIKRLSIDLLGMPPSDAEVDRFVADASEDAYERLVERMLADPRYGERMALPWLDAARYADSNGFQQDGDTWQWIWRDWLVGALQRDMPFDQFTVWQLAGDLLPDATTEQKIASGFNRNHLLNGEGGAIPEEQRFVILFDRMDTTATTWLGLTMACAQCHDHKYDPITMRDYYAMMDAFNHLPENGVPQYFSSRIRVAPPLIELPTAENLVKIAEFQQRIDAAQRDAQPLEQAAFESWKLAILASQAAIDAAGLPDSLRTLLGKPQDQRNEDEKAQLESGLKKHFDDKIRPSLAAKLPKLNESTLVQQQLNQYRNDQIPRVMVMSDTQKRETSILDRGNYLTPTEKISFTTPAFLPPLPEGAPANRLGLAQWLISDQHPLTARVQANRMWQHFFGQGLVKTSEDFGVQGEYPLHLDLLDWLASEYRKGGWSSKRLQRTILLSATYQQSSRITPEALARDAENRYLGRGARFRMPSLILRDWALSVSGLLERRIGGAPVYPYQPDGVWESLAITKERDFSYPESQGSDLYRRSLYTFWRRTVGPSNMFDASNRQACRVRASQTSTPLHALTTLNDPTWIEASRVLAAELLQNAPSIDIPLQQAFRRTTLRSPTESELDLLRSMYLRQVELYRQQPELGRPLWSTGKFPAPPIPDDKLPEASALATVCLAIFNLDESLNRE
jgi:hypothetical protein